LPSRGREKRSGSVERSAFSGKVTSRRGKEKREAAACWLAGKGEEGRRRLPGATGSRLRRLRKGANAGRAVFLVSGEKRKGARTVRHGPVRSGEDVSDVLYSFLRLGEREREVGTRA